MRAVVVGTGTVGSAVSKPLKQDAHQVVAVGGYRDWLSEQDSNGTVKRVAPITELAV